MTYIHYAAAYADPTTLELFSLNFPSYLGLLDEGGKKPIDYAEEYKNEANVKYLMYKDLN